MLLIFYCILVLSLVFVIFETLVIKAFVIPWFLDKVIKKTHAHRDTDANIPHFYCLVISIIFQEDYDESYRNAKKKKKNVKRYHFL